MHEQHDNGTPGLDAFLGLIPTLEAGELERVRKAVERRRREVAQSTVLERHAYRAGLLQLETRIYPNTGKTHGPYWYYRYREDGRQRTLYVGVTDSPESAVEEKLEGRGRG